MAAKKPGFGNPLDVLGVSVRFHDACMSFLPRKDKLAKWLALIEEALRNQTLSSGDASKMAGRLNWACQSVFRRLGRAMLQPLYAQARNPLKGGRIGSWLRLALTWWCHVLRCHLCEHFQLCGVQPSAE